MPLFEETTFMPLVCRLLEQARRTWPPAMKSIAHMVPEYFRQLAMLHGNSCNNISPKLRRRLSLMFNKVLHRLSLPAYATPFKSMEINWNSQKVLLASAIQFSPSLVIDKVSYRAVAKVFAASKKSLHEEKYAQLMEPSWPPWRKEQDGMDVQRTPAEDLSRVTIALSKMTEAGYPEDRVDRGINMLGGRDSDGTPTIQTRTLPDITLRKPRADCEITEEWTARIRATRDAQEAWNAFTALPAGVQPSHPMYHAMFEKLCFEEVRSGRRHQYDAAPGDGKEVTPVPQNNFSESEKLRTRPPNKEQFYSQMVQRSARPSGRLLSLLLFHAKNLQTGIMYLRDSYLPKAQVDALLGNLRTDNSTVLAAIPDHVMAAFIKLVCRSARHTANRPLGIDVRSNAIAPFIRRQPSLPYPRIMSNPLLHALELLKAYRQPSRSPWYVFFVALAQKDIIIDRKLGRDPFNDILAWKILSAALKDSHKFGLKLDPLGLKITCNGLEKALVASRELPNHQAAVMESGQVVQRMFAELTDIGYQGPRIAEYHMPTLLHTVEGSVLHAYVRVLGMMGNKDLILAVARWMVMCQLDLNRVALSARNGRKSLRKTIVSMRVFVDEGNSVNNEAVTQLRSLIEELDGWEGWPTDDEVKAYLSYDSGGDGPEDLDWDFKNHNDLDM